MKRKSNLLQLIVVASFALLLAACGSDSKGKPPGGDGGAGGDGGTWGTGGDGGSGATDGTGGTGGSGGTGGTGGTGGGVDEGACLEMCDHVYLTCKSSLDRTHGRCQFDCKNGLISEELMNCASGACTAIPSCLPGGDGGSGGDPGTGGTGGDPGTGGTGGDPGTGGTGGGGPQPTAACLSACQHLEVTCGGGDQKAANECAVQCTTDAWPTRVTTCVDNIHCDTDLDKVSASFLSCLGWPRQDQCDGMCQNVYQCSPQYFSLNGTPVSAAQCPAVCMDYMHRDSVVCSIAVPIPANPTWDYCFNPTSSGTMAGVLAWCEGEFTQTGDPPPRAECTQVCYRAHLPVANGGCGYSFPDRDGGLNHIACMMNCEAFADNNKSTAWSDEYLHCMHNAMSNNKCTGMAACSGK